MGKSLPQKRDLWQFTLRDLDEDGHVLCFFEQYGDVESSTGMIYYCTMEEGDWYSASKLLEGERCSSVFYLDNGEQGQIITKERDKYRSYMMLKAVWKKKVSITI